MSVRRSCGLARITVSPRSELDIDGVESAGTIHWLRGPGGSARNLARSGRVEGGANACSGAGLKSEQSKGLLGVLGPPRRRRIEQ
jgi:hypothetical protein